MARGGYLGVLPDLRLLAIADDGANELVERVLRGEARLPERLAVVGVVRAVVSCAAANDQSTNQPITTRSSREWRAIGTLLGAVLCSRGKREKKGKWSQACVSYVQNK